MGVPVPTGTDCATLARYIATVLNGLAVQSASGATEKELRRVAALAMLHGRLDASPRLMDSPPSFRTHLALIRDAFNQDRTLGLHSVKELTSDDLTRLCKVETWAAGEELSLIAVADVAEEV
jgi:hypothetical protein